MAYQALFDTMSSANLAIPSAIQSPTFAAFSPPSTKSTLSIPLLSPNPPQRCPSAPQLHVHRGSKVDLRDLINLTPTFPMTGIFDIGSGHYDVLLQRDRLSWKPLDGISHAKGEHYPKVVRVGDIFAVQIQRIQRAGQEEGGYPRGVSVFVVRPKEGVANGLAWEEITLASNNESCCQQWFQAVLHLINGFPERPKRLRLFIDAVTSHKTKQVYEDKVKRLLHFARVQTDIVEATHKGFVQECLEQMDFDDVDGVVCIGGDAIANEAVHGLLLRAQRDAGITISQNTPLAKCRIPLGIIPVGVFNIVAHSSQGINDPVTSLLHIILGHLQPLDVCTVFSEDGFLRFGFSAMYGFGSDCLRRAIKSPNFLKSKSVEYAMAKSLVKLRAYECEVSYQPWDTENSDSQNAAQDSSTCLKGCGVCGHAPDLTHLVRSTPLPLRWQDSPLAMRRRSSNVSQPGTTQNPTPGGSPRQTPSPRGSLHAPRDPAMMGRRSVPSIPVIAWNLDTTAVTTSEECLVTPKKGRDKKKPMFIRRASHEPSGSAPRSRPTSAGAAEMFSTRADATSLQRNLRNALMAAGRGDGGGGGSRGGPRRGESHVPRVNISQAEGGGKVATCRGIGIIPKEGKSAMIETVD